MLEKSKGAEDFAHAAGVIDLVEGVNWLIDFRDTMHQKKLF